MKDKSNSGLTFLTLAVVICVLIIGSSATQSSDEQNAFNNDSAEENEFPYPRGTVPPYGMMGWETGTQF